MAVSVPEERDGGSTPPEHGEGVLSNLPRTRPQRASPRRAAARSKAAAAPPASAKTNSAGPSGAARARTKPTAAPAASASGAGAARRAPATKRAQAAAPKKPRRRKPLTQASPRVEAPSRRRPPIAAERSEPVPRQGFASEADRVSGPVAPPGGPELLATAAEAISEIAKAGIATGERLVRDVLSRLPLS